MTVESPQISGKVFRFLSAMHPALSKAERKRYASYDPDQWYEWSSEISAEFADLMRRSPRDTSFARGFAYVAQRAVPEGHYIPTGDLIEHLKQLPAAFRAPDGTGFSASIDRPGHATVSYCGMPGFANVCIAIQGELTQRLQASGAQSVLVKHAETCRVSGGAECSFDVEWSGEAPPGGAQPADAAELLDEELAGLEMPEKSADGQADVNGEAVPGTGPHTSADEQAATPVEDEAARASVIARLHAETGTTGTAAGSSGSGGSAHVGAAAAETVPVERPRSSSASAGAEAEPQRPSRGSDDVGSMLGAQGLELDSSSDDLFAQLRKRLAEADRQSRMFAEAQSEIEALRVELGRVRAKAEADTAKAGKERDEAIEALAELKRRVRSVIVDD